MIYKLLNMSTDELFAHLLEQFPDAITDGCNYIFEPHGYEHNTMLVAHLDTVDDSMTMKDHIKDIKTNTKGVMRNAGMGVLGADDRAGVFAILKILKSREKKGEALPPVLFTNYEECGGIGVGEFCKEQHIDRKDVHLMVEIDREGRNQFVTYSENDQEVLDYAESFGYTEHTGVYSDIKDLSDEFEIPSINVSAGYFNQHTHAETLNMNYLWESINKVKDMLDNPIEKCYNVKESNDWWDYGYSSGEEYNSSWHINKDEYVIESTEDEVSDFLERHTEDDRCKNCLQHWFDCNCGSMLGLCSFYLKEKQIECILDKHAFYNDKIYRGLVGLKEYFHELK